MNEDDGGPQQNNGREFRAFRKKEVLYLGNVIDRVIIKKVTNSNKKEGESHRNNTWDELNIKKATNRDLSILAPAMSPQANKKIGATIEKADMVKKVNPKRQPTEERRSPVSSQQVYYSTSSSKIRKKKLPNEKKTTNSHKSMVAPSSQQKRFEKTPICNEKSIGEPKVSSLKKLFLGFPPFSLPLTVSATTHSNYIYC